MKKVVTVIILFGLLAQVAPAVLVYSTEFNTAGDVEGWVGSAQVSGLRQAATVGSGGEGVLTCNNITGTDPTLSFSSGIVLPTAESWSCLEFRFRQLNADPPNGVPVEFVNTGTRLELAVTGSDARITPLATADFAGARSYSSDTFAVTVTTDADHWVKVTVDLSNAPYLNSRDLPKILIKPTNNSNWNFELDYVRLYDTSVAPKRSILGLFSITSAQILMLHCGSVRPETE